MRPEQRWLLLAVLVLLALTAWLTLVAVRNLDERVDHIEETTR